MVDKGINLDTDFKDKQCFLRFRKDTFLWSYIEEVTFVK